MSGHVGTSSWLSQKNAPNFHCATVVRCSAPPLHEAAEEQDEEEDELLLGCI